MAILKILTFPHPNLRKKSIEVKSVTPELVQLAHDMLETMDEARGVGLAAPQVNKQVRLIVVDTRPNDENGNPKTEGMTELEKNYNYPLFLFNPVVLKKEGTTTYGEGCLSVPGFFETVERANYIEAKALNEKGEEVIIKTDGLLAICIQHEIDHLDGKLFIDRISFLKSSKIKSKIKKHGYPDTAEKKQHAEKRTL